MKFRNKLLLMLLLLVLSTVVVITFISLQNYTKSLTFSGKQYLINFVRGKSYSTYLHLDRLVKNLESLGKVAQDLLDSKESYAGSYNSLVNEGNQSFYSLIEYPPLTLESKIYNRLVKKLGKESSAVIRKSYKYSKKDKVYKFVDKNLSRSNRKQLGVLLRNNGIRVSMSSKPTDRVEMFLAHDVYNNYLKSYTDSKNYIDAISLLTPAMHSTFEGVDEYVSLIYGVGDKKIPFIMAYPNYNIVNILGSEKIFWRDYFPEYVPYYEKLYKNKSFRENISKNVGSIVNSKSPYIDEAGQGLIMTMFYPLWHKKKKKFGGVIALDIKLDGIVQNIIGQKLEIAPKTGFSFLMDAKGEILGIPKDRYKTLGVNVVSEDQGGVKNTLALLRNSKNPGIREFDKIVQNTKVGNVGYEKIKLEGDNYYFAYAVLPPLNDKKYAEDRWKIVVCVSEQELLAELYQVVFYVIIASIIVIFFVIIVAVFLSSTFSKNIVRLSEIAQKVSKKNYNVHASIDSNDEVGQLAKVFNAMIKDIKDYTENLESKVADRTKALEEANLQITSLNDKLQDENIRMSSELDVARKLQMMVLPHDEEIKKVKGLDIGLKMVPADEVGGDYYDVIDFEDQTLIGIGDVTGHGLASGVLMLMAQTAFLALSTMNRNSDIPDLLITLNRVLFNNLKRMGDDKTMTMSLISYNKKGDFTITGQHENVIICRKDGKIEVIDTMDLGFYIGMLEDVSEYADELKFHLNEGDVVLLYTDGITEAINEDNVEYEVDRLTSSLKEVYDQNADKIVDHIVTKLYDYIGKATVYDDISLVVIKQKNIK